MNWHKQKEEFIYEENCTLLARLQSNLSKSEICSVKWATGLSYDIEMSVRAYKINFRFS